MKHPKFQTKESLNPLCNILSGSPLAILKFQKIETCKVGDIY